MHADEREKSHAVYSAPGAQPHRRWRTTHALSKCYLNATPHSCIYDYLARCMLLDLEATRHPALSMCPPQITSICIWVSTPSAKLGNPRDTVMIAGCMCVAMWPVACGSSGAPAASPGSSIRRTTRSERADGGGETGGARARDRVRRHGRSSTPQHHLEGLAVEQFT